jgi:hypothetical protein
MTEDHAIAAADRGYRSGPERLRRKVAAYLVGGAALIALGALIATGVF